MKMRETLRRAILLATVFVAVVLFIPIALERLALAQTPVPMGPMTTMAMIVLGINIVVGFIGQGVQQGSILGIVTVPKSYVPYLTVVAAFGTSVGTALGTGTPVLPAILLALFALASGTSLSHHFGTQDRTEQMRENTKASGAVSIVPPAPGVTTGTIIKS